MHNVFKMRGLRYVNIAFQISKTGHKTCKAIKIKTSNEVLPGKPAGWPLPFMN